MPNVSVVVATYNGLEHLGAFFESLAAALPDRAEVIVVDDCSPEPVLEAVPEITRAENVIRLRNETNLGHSGTLNRGLAAAAGDILIQLNSDLVLDRYCISAMVEAIERGGSSIGIVGSRLLYPTTGRTQTVGLAFGRHSKRHVFRNFPADHPLCLRSREVQVMSSATAAFSKRVLDRLGPLDEEQYNHNLDLDHCLRALELGLRNYMCADSLAYHWRNRSGPIRYARVEAAEAAFWSKWGGRYKVDLGEYFDEALDHLLSEFPHLDGTPFTILDLTRGGDREIAVDRLEDRWEGISGRTRSFRQMNNDSDRLWLPLLVPNWLAHDPIPFIYLVDSHMELEENAMWFARRRGIVCEEIIVDLSASICTTSEFLEWQAGTPAEPSVQDVVDVVDP
jgi:GT2 family glycosyltransferase